MINPLLDPAHEIGKSEREGAFRLMFMSTTTPNRTAYRDLSSSGICMPPSILPSMRTLLKGREGLEQSHRTQARVPA
jgi:hypothetical protein